MLSTQHAADVETDRVRAEISRHIIASVIPQALRAPGYRELINPTGRFVIGGPKGDTGLTGRKIIVDTYGGAAPHGGGAFSGKDPSKVDRSAAYAAGCIPAVPHALDPRWPCCTRPSSRPFKATAAPKPRPRGPR